jgi:branched-chain amino acid transport system permease protein
MNGAKLDPSVRQFLLQLAPLTVIALALPLLVNSGIVFLAGLVCINIVVALAFNLLFTTAGIMSFGQAMFVATGAYAAGLIGLHWPGVPYPAALLAAGVLGGLLAVIVGTLALRRSEGVTFAMVTLTFAELLHIVITKTTFLGRNDGLTGIVRPVLLRWPVRIDLAVGDNFYVFIVLVCALLCAVLWWVSHSRFGRTLQAVRMDPQRAAFLSVDGHRYRMAALMVSGAVTAIAGGLYGPWTQLLSPELAYWGQSTVPLLDTLLGGAGVFWGPAVGAVAFAFIEYETREIAGVSDLVAGVLLLSVVLAVPGGLVGIVAHCIGFVRRRRRRALVRRPS